MKKHLLFGLALVLISSAAQADYSVAQFHDAKKHGDVEWEAMRFYINGLGDGLQFANSQLIHDHKELLFCQPDTLILMTDNYLQMVEAVITERKLAAEVPVGLALLIGLRNTFPCPAAK
jgi:hypothetical protein